MGTAAANPKGTTRKKKTTAKKPASMNMRGPDQAPRGRGTGRKRMPDKERVPRDINDFIQAIHESARDLDFALRMFAVELEAQLFTADRVEEIQRKVFKDVIQKIATTREGIYKGG